jgi:hypothetical protein
VSHTQNNYDVQHITLNLKDEFHNSEISDMEGEKDDDNDEPFSAPIL